jgi:WD40 repeat protein
LSLYSHAKTSIHQKKCSGTKAITNHHLITKINFTIILKMKRYIFLLIAFFITGCVSTDRSLDEEPGSQTSLDSGDSDLKLQIPHRFYDTAFWEQSKEGPLITFTKVYALAMSPDGKYIVAGCYGYYDEQTEEFFYFINIYDFENGALVRQIVSPFGVRDPIAVSPDNKYITSWTCFSGEDTIHIWNFKSGKLHKTIPEEGINSFALSPDGEYLVSGNYKGVVNIYGFPDGKLIRSFTDILSYIHLVKVSPDSRYIAAFFGGYNKKPNGFKIWELETGKLMMDIKDRVIYSAAFTPDSKQIVAHHRDPESEVIEIWNIQTGGLVKTIEWSLNLSPLVVNPDGSYLIGCSVQYLTVIDIETGELLALHDYHTGTINSLCISPDGNYLLTGSEDCTIRLWEMDTIGEKSTRKTSTTVKYPVKENYSHVYQYRLGDLDPKVTQVPRHILENLAVYPHEYLYALVMYLISNETDDFRKVQLIHDWIIYYLDYSWDLFDQSKIEDYQYHNDYSELGSDITLILESKKGACHHYSLLFMEMCRIAGFNAKYIFGYSLPGTKESYTPYDDKIGDFWYTRHAWNAVEIEGYWYLIDVTYDEGHYEKHYWMYRSPEVFIREHFPQNKDYQFLDEPYTLNELAK